MRIRLLPVLLLLAGCSSGMPEAARRGAPPAVATLELPPDLPATASRDVLSGYFETEAARLRSEPFLQKVLEALPPGVRARRPEFASPRAFAAALGAERAGGAFLLRVRLQTNDTQESLRVLDTLAGMFVDEARGRRADPAERAKVKVLEPARLE